MSIYLNVYILCRLQNKFKLINSRDLRFDSNKLVQRLEKRNNIIEYKLLLNFKVLFNTPSLIYNSNINPFLVFNDLNQS